MLPGPRFKFVIVDTPRQAWQFDGRSFRIGVLLGLCVSLLGSIFG